MVLHAYHLQNTAYHHAFLAVTVLSVLFHSGKSHKAIAFADKLAAHCTFLLVLTDTQLALQRKKPYVLAFPFWAAVFWFAQSFAPARSALLHALLHLTGVVGMHVYLRELYA